ncbi:MAG: cytochrome c oxidase subunit II [Actinomycetota bacterium]|nr:cytochrome c oxidase subunit II [Actinomycetota bacterium]
MLAGEIQGNHPLRRHSHRKGPGVIRVLPGAGLLLGACAGRGGAYRPASRQGGDILDLWRILLAAGVAMGVLVLGLILWSVLRYRRPRHAGPGDLPVQTRANVPLEVFYTVIPLVIVAGLFAVTLRTQHRVTRLSAVPGVSVEVTGFQWGWRFRYPAQSVTVTGDANRPPTLVLPVGADVRFRLATNDVIHSFFVPAFLVKRDLIPGIDNQIEVHPTRLGSFRGFCAEFCGLDHWRMTFDVEVVTPQAFQAFVDGQQPVPGQQGPVPGNTGGLG